MTLVGILKRANAKGKPEESVALRGAILVAVVTAASATLAQGVGGWFLRLAATAGIAGAFVFSHRARHRDGYLLKALLAVSVVIVFADFLSALSGLGVGALNQVQVPLAELFLWVQVLHSLDVPARRDLLFSLLSSLVLMAVAGVLSVSATLAPYIAVWAVAAIVSLVLAHRSEHGDHPKLANVQDPEAGVRTAGSASRQTRVSRPVVTVVALALALATAVFLLLPAAGPGRAIAFPAVLPNSLPIPNPGGLANPSLGGGDPASPDGTTSSRGTGAARFGYFGFANELDTSVRGRPDDTLVMRVRASRPDFWRGQTFDTWNGRTWTQSDQRVAAVGGDMPIGLRAAPEDQHIASSAREEFVQTVYVARPGPNLIFAARVPTRLYFTDRRVFQMSDGTIRTAVHLDAGAVYTVVSKRVPVTAEILRSAGSDGNSLADDPALVARYTQVPRGTPQRVLDLASSVTAGTTNRYDRVRALETWMAANTEYTLDIPRLPRGDDAVDRFLFVDRRGFCEQIASSLVVMLRSLGVPARLAVGYAAGERNPFTGMFEVRASDAHAWAEVWFPGVGWQSFDPTASVPLSGDPFSASAAAGLLEYVRKRLPDLPDMPNVPPAVPVAVIIGAAMATAGSMFARARARCRRRAWADVTLERLERLGAERGRPRYVWESPTAYANTLSRSVVPDTRLERVAEIVERDAFSPEAASPNERETAEAILEAIGGREAPLLPPE